MSDTAEKQSIDDLVAQLRDHEGFRGLVKDIIASQAKDEADAQRRAQREAADKAKREQRARDRDAAKAAERARVEREKRAEAARAAFDKLTGAEIVSDPAAFGGLVAASIVFDDGKRIEPQTDIPVLPEEFAAHHGNGLLWKHPQWTLSVDEPFVATGAIVHGMAGDTVVALRCSLPTPLPMGGGQSALIAADSLVFRPIPRAAG